MRGQGRGFLGGLFSGLPLRVSEVATRAFQKFGRIRVDTIELGHDSDTTVVRSGAGDLSIEGNVIYRAGGTDVVVTDGGTGASNASDARTNLGLVIGTNVQAFSSVLSGVAGAANVTSITGNQNQVYYMLKDSDTVLKWARGDAVDLNLDPPSDGRLKFNRRPIDESGEVIDALEPIWFTWGEGEDAPLDFGFIAQDAYTINPMFATPGEGEPNEEGFRPWKMRRGRMDAFFAAELKSLRKRVAELEAQRVV